MIDNKGQPFFKGIPRLLGARLGVAGRMRQVVFLTLMTRIILINADSVAQICENRRIGDFFLEKTNGHAKARPYYTHARMIRMKTIIKKVVIVVNEVLLVV